MAVVVRNCPHCPAQHSTFAITWNGLVFGLQNTWAVTAVCGACGHPIVFLAKSASVAANTQPAGLGGNLEPSFVVGEIWPSRALPIAPPHTPNPVAKRYLEGEDAFSRSNWNSAVAMYRSALDIATKGIEGAPKEATFFKRLEWLHANNKITPEIKSWADHVRVEGNAALHDPEEFDQNDAKALRFFTEMFLRYVFELPGAVKEFREKTKT
ncbi:DUF4145 domain-containing protein [Bradyrhizobium diazoefficiens]|nr:DUF4145 domain-containing protein [Bradyrhizobium diazoefficiens]MBR0703127.1 DUF4145 domain-containing protein [Bradyrhizobium diazoefficiens]MBR0771882.1 DUF4145 domain-containing protein [Bradyrhizobium diazoefficiens]